MHTLYPGRFSRRRFLGQVTLVGTAGLLGVHLRPSAAEPPPETTKLRLVKIAGICIAPQYVAEELLRGEGFTEVQYVETVEGASLTQALTSGQAHISLGFAAPFIIRVDAGDPIVMLAGVHVGCFELFGSERVRAIRDLKGKTVAVEARGSSQHVYLASMAAYVGVDPDKDIHWLTYPRAEAMQLFEEGKIDAYLGIPPDPQHLRGKKVGHVVVNSTVDRPWSQYFCCVATGNQEFVRKHPIATKRALRAIMKATDVCALEPERAAQAIVDKGFTPRYEYALQTMQEVPYDKWREYDPEDTVRFYALRLQEAGMIKSSPQKILAQGTDWRFFKELKKELKR
jgi:NitT/TauT family transport system substrate-binding protein